MKNKKLLCSVCFLFTFMSVLWGQSITVKGNVTSKTDGQPVIGASVVEATATANGTITDLDGNFTLSVPANSTLKITYIGYKPVTVKSAAIVNVLLEEDTQMVDEVVVTGYTTQRKADLTGAVSVVKVDEIQKQGENNPVKALQGRVPGMNITADGNPSGSATVRIRGIGTLNNNDPLYIIDGVPTKAGMHELNGNDIESIQVLKDAASASIYGSRAANGVIVITTKQGKKGQIKINFDASVSASMYQSKMDVLNTEQYGRAMWQAYVNDGENPNGNALGYNYNWGYNANGNPVLYGMSLSKYLDSKNTMPVADTDWFDEITRTGVIQQYNLSVSNGSEKGSSFFSLGYYKNLGVIKDTDFDRFSARMNSDYKLIDDILTIGQHFTLNRTSEVQAPGGIIETALDIPSAIPVYASDGSWGGPVGGWPDRRNPRAVLEYNKDNRYTYWRMFGDAYVNLSLFKGFNVRSTFGLDYANKQARYFTYPYQEGTQTNNGKSAVEAKQEHWTKWMWNAIATYQLEIGKHRGDVMAGMELNREDDSHFSGYKEDFSILTPDYMWPDAGSGTAQAYGAGEGYSLVSFFGKMNYSYADKYLLSLTLRRDGSSRFGKNHRYATFPSVSLGWRITQESFMKELTWLDDLKLRASWGQTGNQEISNLARYTIYAPNYGTTDSFGGQSYGTAYDITGSNGGGTLPSGFKRNQIGNDNIKWETTTQTNIGLDLTVLNGRLTFNADYYYKKTKNMLMNVSLPAGAAAATSIARNEGEMVNKGFEFSISSKNFRGGAFTWDTDFNISFNRNKLTKLELQKVYYDAKTADVVNDYVVRNEPGRALGGFYGYISDGVDPETGELMYRDLNHDGKISSSDRTYIGDPNPDFTYGMTNTFSWKGFNLSIFIQGSYGNDVYNASRIETEGMYDGKNQSTRVLGRWRIPGQITDVPKANFKLLNSTYFVEDGSYLRLKDVSLSYNVKGKLLKKWGITRLQPYFTATNLLTWTSYSGMDPEVNQWGNSGTVQGIDWGTYPHCRSYVFGINVEF